MQVRIIRVRLFRKVQFATSPHFQRQEAGGEKAVNRCFDSSFSPKSGDRSVLRFKLRGAMRHDVALHRGHGVFRQTVQARQCLIHCVIRQPNSSRLSDFVDLPHRLFHQRTGLRQTTQHSCGRLGYRTHAAESGDEKELVPDGCLDVSRDLRLNTCLSKRFAQDCDAITKVIVPLTESDKGLEAGMLNMPRLDNITYDLAQTTEDAISSQDGSQLLECFDAVLQRQHESSRSEHRRHGIGRLANLPRLHAQDHDVDISYLSGIIGCEDGRNGEVAVDAVNAKASRAQSAQVSAASDERHVVARERQPPAKISSYAAAAEYRDSHELLFCRPDWKFSNPDGSIPNNYF